MLWTGRAHRQRQVAFFLLSQEVRHVTSNRESGEDILPTQYDSQTIPGTRTKPSHSVQLRNEK